LLVHATEASALEVCARQVVYTRESFHTTDSKKLSRGVAADEKASLTCRLTTVPFSEAPKTLIKYGINSLLQKEVGLSAEMWLAASHHLMTRVQ